MQYYSVHFESSHLENVYELPIEQINENDMSISRNLWISKIFYVNEMNLKMVQLLLKTARE